MEGDETLPQGATVASTVAGTPPGVLLTPTEVLGAVIQLLVAHVSAGELNDVVATLPRPIATLWRELATPKAHEASLTRHTGYSR